MQILDMSAVRREHRGHWFDPSSMRFFRSRVATAAYATADGRRAYFVSSEQFESSNGLRAQRMYSVRVLDRATGSIETAGEFQRYASRSGANAAAQRYARQSDACAMCYVPAAYHVASDAGHVYTAETED